MSFGPPKMNYSDHTTRALTYLLPRGAGMTVMTECIYRVEGEILTASPTGVLLRHVVSGDYLLSGETDRACSALLEKLPQEEPISLLLHGERSVALALAHFPGATAEALHLWRYPSLEPPRFPLPFEVWPLDQGDAADTLAFDPTISPATLGQQIERRMVFGACIHDKLEGTVGTAPGGGISYLTVSPGHRGTGVGRTLLLWMIRKELQRGHVPFLVTARADLVPLFRSAGMEEPPDPLWHITVPAPILGR